MGGRRREVAVAAAGVRGRMAMDEVVRRSVAAVSSAAGRGGRVQRQIHGRPAGAARQQRGDARRACADHVPQLLSAVGAMAVHRHPAGARSVTGFADELLAGLSQRPRRVAPKWFYDRRGSELFNRICELPEYYLTRVELALLERHAAELAQGLRAEGEIIEVGAGAAKKVHALARALERPAAYRPIDLSGDFLLDAVAAVPAGLPRLPAVPLCREY